MSSPERQRVSIDVDHNPYLAQGSGTVDAIIGITVEATIPDLALRIWTPAGARVGFVKQVAPTIDDLTRHRVDSGSQTGDYPLDPRGADDRAHHIRVEIEPAAVGREKLAASVAIVAAGEVLAEARVKVTWTVDTALSAPSSRLVAHYTGQEELAQAVREGLHARRDGDVATATTTLRRAMELAVESGNDGTADLLKRIFAIDAEPGTTQLRREIADADAIALDAQSTRTARVRSEGHDSGQQPAAPAPSGVWTAVVSADRQFYQRVLASGGPDTVEFPTVFPERRILLRDKTTVIGRHNRKQGVEPDIDLGIHPSDRGVSTQHAVLRIRESGLTVADLGSTNGTSLNGSDVLLQNGEEFPLSDGDRIHVGAWTTITIEQGD